MSFNCTIPNNCMGGLESSSGSGSDQTKYLFDAVEKNDIERLKIS